LLFYDKLEEVYSSHDYDADLIINVDETTTNAEKTKRATKVIFDPSIDVRPMARINPKIEHVTLCCAIAASRREIVNACLYIKNKSVTGEDEISGTAFNCGKYALAW
jgi:hypothetical protein